MLFFYFDSCSFNPFSAFLSQYFALLAFTLFLFFFRHSRIYSALACFSSEDIFLPFTLSHPFSLPYFITKKYYCQCGSNPLALIVVFFASKNSLYFTVFLPLQPRHYLNPRPFVVYVPILHPRQRPKIIGVNYSLQ